MEFTESRITRQQSNNIDISTWFESTRFHKCEYIRIYFKITSILLLSTILASCGSDIPESNNPPVFTSAKFVSYLESEPDLSYVASAKDADGDTVTYSITGGADRNKFSIDSNTGVMVFIDSPDFEAPGDSDLDNIYVVDITTSDGVHSVTQVITMVVQNSNDNPPVFTSVTSVTIDENTTDTVYIASATDADGGTVTYSITGGADRNRLSIDVVTGILIFIDSPDFDAPTDSDSNNIYEIDITVSDGLHAVTRRLTVTVQNSNDNLPVFTSATSVTVDENTTGTVYVASAMDADADMLTYTLLDSVPDNSNILIFGGIDYEEFIFDQATGALSFISGPDYEMPTYAFLRFNYVVVISASDGLNTVYQKVTINIKNVNDNVPLFTSSSDFSFSENSQFSYLTVSSTDADNDQLTLSVTGGEDRNKFSFDLDTGLLSFLDVPDYEVPGDSDGNNAYEIEVTASDGHYETIQSITVNVINRNDNPPIFISGSNISSFENTTVTGYSALVTDADGDSPTYSIVGGLDANKFSIHSHRGELSFINAPDFEAPSDSDFDNTYIVDISASDGLHTVVQTVTVIVMDLFDLNVSAVDVKTLQFYWQAYSGASFYKLLVNPDGQSGVTVQVDSITDLYTKIAVPVHFTDWVNATYLIQAYDESGVLAETAAIGISSEMNDAIGYFKASNPDSGDFFGDSVALSADGNTLAVGAPDENGSSPGINGEENNLLRSGAVYVYSKSGMIWKQQAYIKASTPGFVDYFGRDVSLSADGNTLAVGAIFEDGGGSGVNGDENDLLLDSGATYVFSRTGDTWSQQAYIKPSNPGENDWFGGSVSLSADGNTLAVAAIKEDSNATGVNDVDNNALSDAGAAYVFVRSETTWQQQAYIKSSNPDSSDFFGQTLSLSGDGKTLAIGSSFEDGSSASINGVDDNLYENAGAVYVYVFSLSRQEWTQQAYVKSNNIEPDDRFGNSVSLSGDGNVLAVGAAKEISRSAGIDEAVSTNFDNTGAVYLFDRVGNVWSQQTFIKAGDPDIRGHFGASVSLASDGNSLAVGSTNSEFNDVSFVGSAYVYKHDGLIWSQEAHIKAKYSDRHDEFGGTVSLSADGDTMAVSAFREDGGAAGINGVDDNSLHLSGAVFLY